MTEKRSLRHCDITDRVRDTSDDARVRITGFFTIHASLRPGRTVRKLVPCLPDDPALELIGTYATCGRFHRPWHLKWEGPIPWSAEHVAEERKNWRERIGEDDFVHAITSEGYASLFERFPPMSHHESAALAKWRWDTDALIRAHEASLAA